MYIANCSESFQWIETLPTYVCYVGEVTVLKKSGLDPVYDQSPSGTRFANSDRLSDGKTIPTPVGVHYTANYQFDDNENIFAYYTDPDYYKN